MDQQQILSCQILSWFDTTTILSVTELELFMTDCADGKNVARHEIAKQWVPFKKRRQPPLLVPCQAIPGAKPQGQSRPGRMPGKRLYSLAKLSKERAYFLEKCVWSVSLWKAGRFECSKRLETHWNTTIFDSDTVSLKTEHEIIFILIKINKGFDKMSTWRCKTTQAVSH